MNIALVFPKSTFLIDPMVYPPLGLWYLAAQLEALGHHCDFYDLSVDKLPQDGDYDQLWVSGTSPQMAEIRKIGATVSGWQHTASVLGGAAPWARPVECMGLGFDLIVSGEADQPILIADVVATAARRPKTTLYLGTQVEPDSMLRVLPPVRRWSHRYHAELEDQLGLKYPTTTMFTSRGCPMACAFCESGRNGVLWDRVVRYEPEELVEEQLRQIAELGFTGIQFYDDILPLNKKRTLWLLSRLKHYGFVWRCFLRTDITVKYGFEFLKEMRDAGLVEVLAGVESADDRIKANVWKGTTIEQDTLALTWCRELGIRFKASVILGLPGETLQSMEATRAWLLTHRPDRVDINTLIPMPGTPLMNPEHEGKFDLYWVEKLPEEFWYKGHEGESIAIVGTSRLAPEEIQDFRNRLVKELDIPY